MFVIALMDLKTTAILLPLCFLFATIITPIASHQTKRETLKRSKRFLIDDITEAFECLFGKIMIGGECVDPEPECNGKTTGGGGCDAYFPNSHLRDQHGNRITAVDGDCPTNDACNCPTAGFYSAGATCELCGDIRNCDYETCTNSNDEICSRCEGVVQDIPYWRAYKISSNRKSCEQACSWRSDSNRCYPGSCSNELVTSCTCTSGFTGTHCRTITDTPTIQNNDLQLSAGVRNENFPPNVNAGPSVTQNDAWTNLVDPSSLRFKFESQFVKALPAFQAYIKAASVGVSAASARFILRSKAGAQRGTTLSRTCGGVSDSSPNSNMLTCEETLDRSVFSRFLPTPFQHEDRLEFTFNSVGGGFVTKEDKENGNTQSTDYFVTSTKTHAFQVHFDTVDPYHCLTGCPSNSLLDTEQIITTADVTIRWSGWADDAAGLSHFKYRAFDLTPGGGVLRHASIDKTDTISTSASSGQTTFSLNGSPGIYAVLLDVYDRAGNVKSARKLVLYDDGSLITRSPTTPLRVTSAAAVTSWNWQQTEGAVTVTWAGRYANTFHDHNKVLDEVETELDVESSYDDNEGSMTVAGVDNIVGIVKFRTAYSIDNQGGTTLSLPDDSAFTLEADLSGTNTYLANVKDGETLTFWVRACDIRDECDEESVTIHVDSSPPVIHSLWLTKDHKQDLSVHGWDQLSEMTIEWVAYDEDSGLKEVMWRLLDNATGEEIVHGHQFVRNQGQLTDIAHCEAEYATHERGPSCYCTGPVDCFHRYFQVKPLIVDPAVNTKGGIFTDKNTAVHDYDYWIEVTVYNHANLSTTITKQITVDLSPPHPGQVHDGMSGSPEVDYQADTVLHAHWSGFFDRESGVKYYQYAFDTACVAASAFTFDTADARVTETYNTFATWTAPDDGTYHVTVVAFNSALEPSAPVCSDGVTVDTTPPAMADFYVSGAHVAGGVVLGHSPTEVWLIDSERRRRLVDSPDTACIEAASTVSVTLDSYAVSPLTSPVTASEACAQGALDSRFVDRFYLARNNHLFLNWTGSDPHSGIHDYEVGLATSGSADVPDISGYQTTHHHAFYEQFHPTLTQGTPFYILVKAINKAGLETVQALGPVELVRSAPTYTGSVTLTLTSNLLQVTWDTSLFIDVEDPRFLEFTVALEEQTGGAILRPHAQPQFSGSCSAASPPSCATFDLDDLHWGLHDKHTYVAKVRVTNIVGLDLQLTSEPYVHDTRLAAPGSVYERVPSWEEDMLGIRRWEDTDFQQDTTTLEAAWSGFEDGSQGIAYSVGLGSTAGSDDVSSFVDVAANTDHVFSGLSLLVDSKYYVTVVAKTNGGNVTVISDGVTVIQADQTETGITVKDGTGCNSTDDHTWTPEHHDDILSVPCEDDVSFQTSMDTLRAHWTMTSDQRHRYPDVLFKVEKNVPGTDSWFDVTSYTSSPRNDAITAQGVSLQAGGHFRLAVKFCVSSVCTLPVYSDGVYIIPRPPVTGPVAVVHSNTNGTSTLEMTMERFRDGDISGLTTAQSAMLGYQWSLAHRLKGNTHPTLTGWKDVTDMHTVNSTHGRFTVDLTGSLSFHKCLVATIRGVNKVGMVSLVRAPVLDCAAVDPAPIVPLSVLDAVGLTVAGSPSDGQNVTLGFNDAWNNDDDDYTPHSNVISAVWPEVRNSEVTWAVLESQGPDVTSHFQDPVRQTLLDPCSSPLLVACGQVTNRKYVNVDFGAGSSRPALQNGHHYYVCIHAKAEDVTFEKWTERLPDVTGCSDGVTVDLTPPVGGVVSVDGLLRGMYQTSGSVVSVRWTGFSDIEEVGPTAHHSGIRSYSVAVGSVRNGEDVLKFQDVGLVNSFTLHSLILQDGSTYYVTVRAEDHVGRRVAESSEGFVVDSSPPVMTSANFRFAQPYFTSASSISLCWTDMFVDEESGVDSYLVTVGSRPGHSDVMQGQKVTADCQEFHTDVSMTNGHSYYVTVGATNRAGLETVATSKPVVAMTTSPPSGMVLDGLAPSNGATAADVDFVTSPGDVAAFWSSFATPLAPVASYSVRLGTCPGCGDVVADSDVGLSTEVTWSHAQLRHDLRYYTTVIACNAVGRCSEVTSDGVMIDVMPPVTGPVWDGAGDEDIAYQSQRDFLAASWRGFSDLGSGLAAFSWRAGTTPGGSDVMTERDLGLTFTAFTTFPADTLPEGQMIYVTVTASDAAGNRKEMTSNGFQVDTSPPLVSTVPGLQPGAGTLDSVGLVSRDMIGVHWSLADTESHVGAQYLSLYSHLYGEFQATPVQVPGPWTAYTFTSLALHDGSKYKVKVTACNLARLCTTSVSADILHDNSPPTTGTFAVATDHSAELSRHLPGWMQWTSNSLRLAWLGFHDQHSGIHSYRVNVGSAPYASDLNLDGTTSTVSHAESGTSYEDEGYVQVYEVPTKTLPASQNIYVTVWAVNGVGLKSHPAMSEFRLELGGAMFLHRRCAPFNCLSHCSCSVQGGTCGASTPCIQYTADNNPNSLLTLSDHADLSVLNTVSPSADSYQSSRAYLAATWTVTTLQGLEPVRYEVSAGRSSETSPLGVFDLLEDRVWRDVGLETSSVIAVPADVTLTTKMQYSTFVRAWYSDGSHAVFKSSGITPIVLAPTTTNLVGRAIKEHVSPGDEKDVDFVTSSDFVYVSWTGKFISTSAPVNSFSVYIGTRPEASDIFASSTLSASVDQWYVTGLALQEATVYYSTVTAEGGGGLVSWDVSDGFLLDTAAPEAGLVMDGGGMQDADFQASDNAVSATWHGFYDAGSGLRRYMWCVGTSSDTSLCDVIPWTDVGLMTSGSAQILSTVSQGTTLYNKVYAEDAAGHSSQVIVSDGVTVDTTPPAALDMVYTNGVNLLDNPSFEADTALNANLTQCDAQPPTSWELTAGSCVTLHGPLHTMSADGAQHAVVWGTLHQSVAGLTPGRVYRLTLRLAHPHNALASQKPVTGHVTAGTVTTPFELDPSLCRGVCDAGLEPVMLWHTFSYVVTASSPNMITAVSTTAASPDQQVAVDDVTLEEIHDVASVDSSSEPAVRSSSVFLPEWSVVQASWHFVDDVSPIVDYQWALGTTRGGVQLQGFRSEGRRQHAYISGLSLTHESSLHVTVLARNAAGMTSVAYSLPMTVDMTPPDILDLWDGAAGDEVDFQTGKVVSARWSVRDSQSSVDSCQWAVGTIPGRGDLLPFQRASTSTPDTYSVSSDVTSALGGISLPTTVYVSVRCYNKAGLPARAATDGVTILAGGSTEQMASLQVLPDSMTQYPVLDSCHVRQDRLRVRWGKVVSQIPVAGFRIVRSSDAGQNSSITPSLPFLLEAADLDLSQSPLPSGSNYNISVNPVDMFGTVNSGTTHTTHVLPDAPTVQANGRVASSVTGTALTLSWPGLFFSGLDLYYEVTAGSVQGAGDIMLWHQTNTTNVVVSLVHSQQTTFNMAVVVTAIDPCGQFVTHSQTVQIVV